MRANVIGAGPNGLAAALVLARAGLQVSVFEAQQTIGGACRTLPLTLPGFLHDFGSAVHPMAAASPFFQSVPMAKHGLRWIRGAAPLAHPLDDGSAVLLHRDMDTAVAELGQDGGAWRRLMQPRVQRWRSFLDDALQPPLRIPKHPARMAAFAADALRPAASLARERFRSHRTQALFAGLAAHSFLPLEAPLSAAVALVLGAAAHAEGWPIPQGGSQAIVNALAEELQSLGGNIYTGQTITRADQLDPAGELTLADVTPRQLLQIAGERLSVPFRRAMSRFRYGPAAFKVDYALSAPVPWTAPDCRQAITVHLGGTLEQIAESEAAVSQGLAAKRPFVLVSQPTLFDPTRAPAGKHVLWAYCHVPHAYTGDATPALEAQIERFAPGFRDCVLARTIHSPAKLESMDANLIGGDIQGGEISWRQFAARPSLRDYATSNPRLFLCSASTPPGGGVHGMCGTNAARAALKSLSR